MARRRADFPGYTGMYDGMQLTNTPIGVIFPETRHGQFFVQNAQNIVIRNSKLYGAGFMAAFFNRWAQSNVVANCWIENTGRDGLYFQGWEPGRGASDGITTLAASYCNKFNVVTNNVFHDSRPVWRHGGPFELQRRQPGRAQYLQRCRRAFQRHGWRPQMINILYYYVVHGFPASGIPYPYDQTNITFYSDKYIVTEDNQGAELNHARNNLIRYNDVSQCAPGGVETQEGFPSGAREPTISGPTMPTMTLLSLRMLVHLAAFTMTMAPIKPTIKGNVMYWNQGDGNSSGIISKGNFQINTGNIIADCIMPQGGACLGPFCEEDTRMTWATNIVAAEVGMPFAGGRGTQTPVQAVKSGYMIVGATDSDANITSICGPNANVAYPIVQTGQE